MSKLERIEKENTELQLEASKLEKQYLMELDSNPKYSLQVDPENKYSMPEKQKEFVRNYVEYKSVPTAAELCEIDMDVAKAYFVAYSSQQEIRRINLALYHRQFAAKMMDLDEIGGYLTSLITDENVAFADRLKTPDKLRVIQMLIDLNKLKIASFQDPSALMNKNVEIEIKNLSVDTIKELLNQNEKKKTIDVSDFSEVITPEEEAYLRTLPAEELLKIINETKGEFKHE